MKTTLWLRIGLVATVATLVSGCAGMGPSQHRRTTDLSAFLYSCSTGSVQSASVPVLALPLKVGMAFVPTDGSTNRGSVFATAGPNYATAGVNYSEGGLNNFCPGDRPISENEKLNLMKDISGQLGQYASIKSAELVPSDYLVARGGFGNLERIQAMYGLDVMILLSYDQVQYTDEGVLTLSYWTIFGAYMVPGEKLDTKTVLEAAVYDIASRKLLFRASGEAQIKSSSTPVNLSEQLRLDSNACLQRAATNLVNNLTMQLEGFRKRASNSSAEFKIERKIGYTGGPFGEEK